MMHDDAITAAVNAATKARAALAKHDEARAKLEREAKAADAWAAGLAKLAERVYEGTTALRRVPVALPVEQVA